MIHYIRRLTVIKVIARDWNSGAIPSEAEIQDYLSEDSFVPTSVAIDLQIENDKLKDAIREHISDGHHTGARSEVLRKLVE